MLPEVKHNVVGKRYEIEDLIGQGGMGAVYQALDRLNGHQVAVKRVNTMPGESQFSTSLTAKDFRLALAQEFKLLASLRHPHIIEVLDYGFEIIADAGPEGDIRQPYFTMELLENAQNFLDAAQDQPLLTQLKYLAQALQALAYLHRREIMHRDLKPGNVLVVDGNVKVLDFGLSAMRERTGATDENTGTAGTLGYIAPEVLIGGPATEAADLYAIGMMGYEMLAGVHPFQANTTDAGTLINHVLYTVPDITQMDVSISIANVIGRLLEKDPQARYQSAREVIEALNEAVGQSVVIETAATRDSYLQAARFVGRDEEMSQLATALDAATNGQGSTWLIGGESGVGKSRLVDELRTQALVRGALVMRGQTVSEGRLPYQLWQPILRWLALLTELTPVQAGLIKLLAPGVVSLPDYDLNAAANLEPQKAQAMLLTLVQQTLKKQNQPTIIILEDLHWANSESIALLAQLHQHIASLPVVVVATFRDDDRPDLPLLLPEVPLLKLDRLSQTDIAQLSRAMLGEHGTQAQVIDLLQRETEGNVFFLIEVVRTLAEEAGHLDQIGLMTLPQHVFAGGVQVIIQRRLQNIPQNLRHLLRLAAVNGRSLDLDLLHHLEPDAEIGQFLITCANAAVLEVLEGDWRFAHDRLRDGVLAQMEPQALQAIHRRIAEGIETLYDPAERAALLAYHWQIADDNVKEGQYVALAGEQALRTGAYQEAVRFFERAITLIDAKALAEHDSQMRRVYLQHRSAEAYLGFGGYQQARELYRESLMISESMGDQPGISDSLYALGNVDFATSNLEQARQHYQDALGIFKKLDNQTGVAKALNSLGNIAYELGDHAIAKQLYQQSLTLSREIGNQWGMAGSLKTEDPSDTSEFPAEHEQARARLTQTLEIQIKAQDKTGMAATYYELGALAYDAKQFNEAKGYYVQALDAFVDVDDTTNAIWTFIRLGATSRVLGEYREAARYLRKAINATLKANDNGLIQRALLGMARLRIAEDKRGDALEILSFLLGYPHLTDSIEDVVEGMVFDMEETLEPGVLALYWEKGKNHTLDSIMEMLLNKR